MFLRTLLWCVMFASSICTADEPAVMRVQAIRQSGATEITSHGTCVAIDGAEFKLPVKRCVLTAAHVVSEPNSEVRIEVDGKWTKCKVARLDTECDLALLYACDDLHTCLRLDQDDSIKVVASAEGKTIAVQSAQLQSSEAAFSMAHGMSGGAVLSKDGKLRGIIVAGVADKDGKIRGDSGIFVSAEKIREFLRRK